MKTDVSTVGPADSLLQAAEAMRRRRVSGLPVVDRRARVVGVLSDRDIARSLLGSGTSRASRRILDLVLADLERGSDGTLQECRRELARRPVEPAMSRPAVSIAPDAPLSEIGRTMHRHGINRLPVIERDRLVGIVTRQDVVDSLDPARRAARRTKPPARLRRPRITGRTL